MKNKKIAALLLAAALVVGSGTYGAYSYFTDRAETKANIEIKVGNLKVTSDSSSEWQYVPVGEKANDKINVSDLTENEVSNIRPGDAFEKEIVIKNTGSLTQDLKIKKIYPNIVGSIKDIPFVVTVSGQSFNSSGVAVINNVEPGSELKLKIRVELPVSTPNKLSILGHVIEEYNRDTPNEFKLDLSQKFFEIEATQPNAK